MVRTGISRSVKVWFKVLGFRVGGLGFRRLETLKR